MNLTPETRRAIVEAAKACVALPESANRKEREACASRFEDFVTPKTILAYEEALQELEQSIVSWP
jgi:hypothetical protein